MNSDPRKRLSAWSTFVLTAAFVAAPCGAQEEAPPEDTGSRLGNVYVDFGTWVAQPTGLQYVPATMLDASGDVQFQRNLEVDHGTSDKTHWAIDYDMPADLGRFSFEYYKHDDMEQFGMLSPAQFVFGEAIAHNVFAGYRNDTLADGFLSRTLTELREFRIDYTREAYRSPRVAVDWFVGWRRVEHSRQIDASYFALAPDLPPVLPPNCSACPDLDPLPDTAGRTSSYEGRGATVGMDIEFPLWRNDVVFEGEIAVTVMRGDLTARYQATNSYYVLAQDIPGRAAGILCLDDATCDDDYELFDDVIENGQPIFVGDRIAQRQASIGVISDGSSLTNLVVENSLGFRWRTPYRRLEVFAGFRQTRYDDIAIDLQPTVAASAPDDDLEISLATTALRETARSVTYEGFYGGVTFRLY